MIKKGCDDVEVMISNSFSSSSDYRAEFNRLSALRNSGMDCSEMVEDLHEKFGGRALLMLSIEWEEGKQAQFIDVCGEEKYYSYHYAWEKDGFIYDPMLGYYKDTYNSYLRKVIGQGGRLLVNYVNSFPLRCYLI